MTIKRLNLYVDKGADWLLEAHLLGVDQKPVNIEGMKFQAFAQQVFDSKVKFLIDCDIKYSWSGVLNMMIPYSRTTKIPPGEYEYNVEAVLTSGRRMRIVEGNMYVSDDITPDVIW